MKKGMPETRRELLEMTLGELVLSASARGLQAVIQPMQFSEDEKPTALIALAFGNAVDDVLTAYRELSDARDAGKKRDTRASSKEKGIEALNAQLITQAETINQLSAENEERFNAAKLAREELEIVKFEVEALEFQKHELFEYSKRQDLELTEANARIAELTAEIEQSHSNCRMAWAEINTLKCREAAANLNPVQGLDEARAQLTNFQVSLKARDEQIQGLNVVINRLKEDALPAVESAQEEAHERLPKKHAARKAKAEPEAPAVAARFIIGQRVSVTLPSGHIDDGVIVGIGPKSAEVKIGENSVMVSYDRIRAVEE